MELFGKSGKVFEEFYYQNGTLFFVFYKTERYNVPIYITEKNYFGEAFDPNKTKKFEDRHYFIESKMIRWLDENKKEIDTPSKIYKEREKDILDFSNKLLTMFKNKT